MLRKSTDSIRDCYQRALEARELALREPDPERRAVYFRIEDRWIGLAQNQELVETLSDFSVEIRRFLDGRWPRYYRAEPES